jgi:hypothetical protein
VGPCRASARSERVIWARRAQFLGAAF